MYELLHTLTLLAVYCWFTFS